MSAKIVDASLIAASRQPDTDAEKAQLKAGRIPRDCARRKGRMGLFIRTIGISRARINIGLANLVYNIKRLIWLDRTATATWCWPFRIELPTKPKADPALQSPSRNPSAHRVTAACTT
jgi:hypothetical protein